MQPTHKPVSSLNFKGVNLYPL